MPVLKKKFCCDDCRQEYKKTAQGTLENRHKGLVRILEAENSPRWNMLRNFEFYAALLEFNDLACLYCSGPLDGSGMALDRVNNKYGHIIGGPGGALVVPSCGSCNRIKG